MCGDGANDCAALKIADCGISLSQSEASIAAPFTSKVQNITAARHLLIEGRAALATAVQAFKFMMLYALIQFWNVVILIPAGANLGEFMYLWQDLVALFPLCIFQATTGSYGKLSKQLPPSTLFSLPIMLSMWWQAGLNLAFQFFIIRNVVKQPFFVKPCDTSYGEDQTDPDIYSYETNVVFMLASF